MIGPGTPAQARRYAQRFRLPFPVAADPDRAVFQQFALDQVLLRLIQRSGVFLVDGAGTMRYAHAATNPSASLHLRQLLGRLRELGGGV